MTGDHQQILLSDRHVIGGDQPFVIAEVAQAHDGSLGMAHAFIDAAGAAGADAVKFQTHIAEAESTPHEPWRVKFSPVEESRFEYWKRMEFEESEWVGLRDHAVDSGLVFLSSPFSEEAVDLLHRLGVPAWKVASGEVTTPSLLDSMLRTEKPVLLSTGMSTWSEIDAAVERVRKAGAPLAVMQCTSAYPCPPEEWGLNVIGELRERYGAPVGFSDHSGTPASALAAAALGADIIEVHVTFSRQMYGPDVPASLTFDELEQVVIGSRAVRTALCTPVDKDAMAEQLSSLRATFGKSLVARVDLSAGTVLQRGHLIAKKPGTGIPAEEIDEVVGRRLKRDVRANEPLKLEDIDANEE